MGVVVLGAAVLAVLLLSRPSSPPVQAQPAPAGEPARPAAQAPPPMFGPSYGEALRDVLELDLADAARFERQLLANPNDDTARLKVMAFYTRADRAWRAEDVRKRFAHVEWLIRHRPDSEVLHSYVSRFSPGDLSGAEYGRAVDLWEGASKASLKDPAVQWNAASFFEGVHPTLYLRYLERTADADPNHSYAIRPLAHLYASAVFEGSALAGHSEKALERSTNVWILGNAANMLQSLYNQTVQARSPNARAAALAERYFLRAKALDPNLHRRTILPSIDLAEVARARERSERDARELNARADQAVHEIRRLPVEAFLHLPPVVAQVLRERNCTVPQPSADGRSRNVIRGEFFAKGERGWAVLCSVHGSSALLAFRNDNDLNPDTLTTTEDRGYLDLSNSSVTYSREITAADRDFILHHYRAYGGPEPPRIDHHGIDDSFLEKASVTWYYYRGKWLQLTGAD